MIAGRWQVIWIGSVLALGGGAARAENLDAGKPAPALFARTCAACHASPRGLVKNRNVGLESFLRQHYTSSPESAAALAAYLMANPGGRAAAGQPDGARRRPGQTAEPPAAKTEPPAHPPPQTATARPDSMVEPVEPRRHREEPGKGAGRGKRQQTKQEPTATPPQNGAEPPAAGAPPATTPPPAAPVAAAPPPPDQPAFSAPSP